MASVSNSAALPQPTLRVQLNQIDYTLIPPGPLDNSTLPCVPVIRVYGPSSAGKKTCLHIHQVYPYFFVQYHGELTPEHVNRYISKLMDSLNYAIALTLKKNPDSPKARYIRAILLVKGIHFYGFHTSYSPFLKILVADPAHISRSVTILQSGLVMSTRFQTFESHLSYILQFMCDFGLYGCGWVDLENVLQRNTQDQYREEETESHGTGFSPSPYFPESRMRLEVDAIAPQILNRHCISARKIHDKLEVPETSLPTEPLVLSVRELWEDEHQRRRAHGLNPTPEIPLDPSDSSRGPGGDWAAEAMWWEEVRNRIEREKTMDTTAEDTGEWRHWTMSTFESIEALWAAPWKVWKPSGKHEHSKKSMERNNGLTWAEVPDRSSLTRDSSDAPPEQGHDGIDVDVSVLSSQEVSQMIEREEAEWEKLLENDDQLIEDDGEYDENEDLGDIDEDLDNGDTNCSDGESFLDPFIQKNHISDPPQEAVLILPSPPHVAEPDPGPLSNSPPTPTATRSKKLQKTPLFPLVPNVSPKEHIPPSTKGELPTCDTVKSDMALWSQTLDNNSHSRVYKTRKRLEFSETHPADNGVQPLKRQRVEVSSQNEDPLPPCSFFSSPSPVNDAIPKLPQTTSAKPARENYAFRTIKTVNMNRYMYRLPPPTVSDLVKNLEDNSPSKIYRAPYYSRYNDAPERPREYAGLLYHLKSDGVVDLEAWGCDSEVKLTDDLDEITSSDIEGWEYASCPPSSKQTKVWLSLEQGKPHLSSPSNMRSQIEGPTQANIYGLKNTYIPKPFNTSRERQTMSLLSLEVFVPTREDKVPDSDIDEIVAVFYSYQVSEEGTRRSGTVIVETARFDQRWFRDVALHVVPSELDLLNSISDIVVNLDPDVIIGWEIERTSWGYLNSRSQQYGLDTIDIISRAPAVHSDGSDQWGTRHTSNLKVAGRHVLNLWRIIRSEQNLTSYTLENVAFNLLQKRIPHYTFSTLSEWYNSNTHNYTARILHYFASRTSLILEILAKSEIITKTAEFARVFGVDFFSVISRGSQFKVESFLFRIAKPESFILLSPSRQDVGKQNAAECMPLIMEPMSAFYTSPLVVLDFQSLYPSIMIAYNYCYSTCLGRAKDFKGRNKLGVVDLNQPPGMLESFSDRIHVAPNGIVYVKPEVRRGLLGRMLVELLETRVMVKQALKGVKDDKSLQRILNARQLSLKYICNVIYGYTSASHSGRMPAVEIADSIVQSGRETLEKAIMLINETKKWGGEVVYGDTDSIFVYLKGKTKEQAFRIGNDIADTITALNPSPVKLKFEKVYLPCVLMAKKRYVGFKYEHIDDEDAIFDAKGIETVRRDGVLAQQKMTENCLKILFRTQNLSEVKDYCCRSWTKLLENRASIQDFIFAKEIRMGTYSDKGPPPPGVAVAARKMLRDPKNEPRYGERLPYVIIRGLPDSRLVDRAIDALEFLKDSHLHLDATYYISRVLIPPLERIFNLVGADVRRWFTEMPKTRHFDPTSPTKANETTVTPDRLNIEEHFQNNQCLVCGEPGSQGLCDECYLAPQETIANLSSRVQTNEKRLSNAQRICATCTGSAPGDSIKCESLDCPWLYSRKRAEDEEERLVAIQDLLNELNDSIEETDTLPHIENPIITSEERENHLTEHLVFL